MNAIKSLLFIFRAKLVTFSVALRNSGSKISLSSYVSNNNTLSSDIKISDSCRVFSSVIESFSYLANNVAITNCHIGRYTSIGPNTIINLGEHPVNLVSSSPYTFSKPTSNQYNSFKKVIIGNDVWIGANVMIKGGVTIGDGAIIGAGSFVNKDIPPYAVVVGTPSEIIKYRFERKTIECLLYLKWWEMDHKDVKRIALEGAFDDVESFIQKINKETTYIKAKNT